MSIARYVLLVLALVVLGLITVWGQLRLLSVGHEVNELKSRRDQLEEETRALSRRIDAVATPAATAEHVKRLGIRLAPPVSPAASSDAASDVEGAGPLSAEADVRAPRSSDLDERGAR